MNTIKLSEVKAGMRTSIGGRRAAADATVTNGRVHIPWVGGGGCSIPDQDVEILHDALIALRDVPTLATAVGSEVRDVAPLLAAYAEQMAEVVAGRGDIRVGKHVWASRCTRSAATARKIARWFEIRGQFDEVETWTRRADGLVSDAMYASMDR